MSIELEIATKNNILVQLYNDKATGVISATEFGIIKNSNTVEIEKLNVRLTDIDFDRKTLEEKINNIIINNIGASPLPFDIVYTDKFLPRSSNSKVDYTLLEKSYNEKEEEKNLTLKRTI